MASQGSLVLEIVTPEKVLLREEVEFVSLFTTQGSLGILPGHTPFISQLASAPLYYISRGQKEWVDVAGGFLRVFPDRVIVISTLAERAKKTRADAAKKI